MITTRLATMPDNNLFVKARETPIAVLPIDIVPGSNPPVFLWRQTVDTPEGRRTVDHRASLPSTAEVAVARLITIAKQLLMENATLRGTVEGMSDRIAAQSELLSTKAEKPAPSPTPATSHTSTAVLPKKGKG